MSTSARVTSLIKILRRWSPIKSVRVLGARLAVHTWVFWRVMIVVTEIYSVKNARPMAVTKTHLPSAAFFSCLRWCRLSLNLRNRQTSKVLLDYLVDHMVCDMKLNQG